MARPWLRDPERRRSPARYFAPLILILLLATALRVHRLGEQSFWNDEGNTARLVERPIALIIEGAAGDIHPPGYYLGLHVWRAVAGESEFALRAYSALSGVVMVAVVAVVASVVSQDAARRRPGATTVGGATVYGAAVAAAIHPLAVSYGQEARMYAQLGLATALTLWAAIALVARAEGPLPVTGGGRRPTRRPLLPAVVALGATISLGLYTQYAYVLALAGLNLAFGPAWLLGRTGQHRRLLGSWLLAHIIGGLAFLPWAPIALRAGGWRPPDLAPGRAAGAMVQTLIAGITLPDPVPLPTLIAAGLLILLALWMSLHAARKPVRRFALWSALGMALIPPAVIVGAGIYRPAYLKFLMVSVAPLCVALAAPLDGWLGQSARSGIRRLSRILALIMALTLLPVAARSLHHLYNDPAYQRDDYRGVAALIRAEGREGDAILLSAPNQWEVFTYYYRETAGDALPVYPAPYRPDPQGAQRWVDEITATHDGGRLFVLYWGDLESDPERLIEHELARRAFKASDTWITSVRLARYGTGASVSAPGIELSAQLGHPHHDGEIELMGYHLPAGTWQPGDVLPLTLFWRTERSLAEPLKVFVHLVDEQGGLVAQTDMEPQGGLLPTWAWTPEKLIVDRYGVLLPHSVEPGSYGLRIGMYRFSGERLPITVDGVATGDYLSLEPVIVSDRR